MSGLWEGLANNSCPSRRGLRSRATKHGSHRTVRNPGILNGRHVQGKPSLARTKWVLILVGTEDFIEMKVSHYICRGLWSFVHHVSPGFQFFLSMYFVGIKSESWDTPGLLCGRYTYQTLTQIGSAFLAVSTGAGPHQGALPVF